MRGFNAHSETVIIPCPSCGHETAKPSWWIQSHSQLSCPECRHVVRFANDGSPRVGHLKRHIRGFVSKFAKTGG